MSDRSEGCGWGLGHAIAILLVVAPIGYVLSSGFAIEPNLDRTGPEWLWPQPWTTFYRPLHTVSETPVVGATLQWYWGRFVDGELYVERDPWWQTHFMSPKARSIERNLGIVP